MELVVAVGSIILIDLVLSGDNAVVIGMAAHRLPPRQRRWAILLGAGAAIALRVALTAVAALLLQVPLLKLVGGALLLWIAWKLLKEEDEAHGGAIPSGSFREAIRTIVIADFIMSTDNILGVAAAARGEVVLLVSGLVLSMAIMMLGGTIIAAMIDRFWWLVYLGGGAIAWTGAEMVLNDPVVRQRTGDPGPLGYVIVAVVTVGIVAMAHYVHRHRPAQLAAERGRPGAGG